MFNLLCTLLILTILISVSSNSVQGAVNSINTRDNVDSLIFNINTNVKTCSYISCADNKQYLLSQLNDTKKFYIELSYNPDQSDVLSKDVLSKALREMTTIFIGSGFTYVDKEDADFLTRVFIDAEISKYKRGDSYKYDFLSKVTLKILSDDEKILEQVNKNTFLSGYNLDQLAVDSISKSSTLAAKEAVGNLKIEDDNIEDEPVAASPALKVELLFEGSADYKLYESINKIFKESLSEIKVLKRTIRYGNSISMLVLSTLQSQQIAQFVIDKVVNKDAFEVINVTDNRVVFRIN